MNFLSGINPLISHSDNNFRRQFSRYIVHLFIQGIFWSFTIQNSRGLGFSNSLVSDEKLVVETSPTVLYFLEIILGVYSFRILALSKKNQEVISFSSGGRYPYHCSSPISLYMLFISIDWKIS